MGNLFARRSLVRGIVMRWGLRRFVMAPSGSPPGLSASSSKARLIVDHQVCAMEPKVLGVVRSRDAMTRPEIPQVLASIPTGHSSTTTVREGSTQSNFAATRKCSGAGFPARFCAWTWRHQPAPRTGESTLAAYKTRLAVLARGNDGDLCYRRDACRG